MFGIPVIISGVRLSPTQKVYNNFLLHLKAGVAKSKAYQKILDGIPFSEIKEEYLGEVINIRGRVSKTFLNNLKETEQEGTNRHFLKRLFRGYC